MDAMEAAESSKATTMPHIAAVHSAHGFIHPKIDAAAIAMDANGPISACPAIKALNLLGLSFRTADLEMRSRVSFLDDRLTHLLERLKDAGVAECLAVCTCNRTEIIYFGDDRDCVRRVLAELADVNPDELAPHLYALHGPKAADHVFRVCAGLDSAVLGETDIIAQIKQAWTTAQNQGCAGPWMNLLMRHALGASKRVRTETELCRGVTSLGTQAVREASRIVGGLNGRNVLLIGAGKIIERVSKDLTETQPERVTIANRTERSAAVLAARHGFDFCGLSELESRLVEADLVLSAVSAGEPILSKELLASVIGRRRGRTLHIVDLGVPPNLDAHARLLEGIDVVDLDHVIARCAANSERREAAIPDAGIIVGEAVDKFVTAFVEREAAGAIQQLVDRCQAIREQNLAWAMDRLEGLDDRQRKVIEDLTLRMVRGLLESPIRTLKSAHFGAAERDLIVRLFEAQEPGVKTHDSEPNPQVRSDVD